MAHFRGVFQASATLLSNLHLANFGSGGIYRGVGKAVCVPGLNCYSCPAASAACPIGAFQAVAGSSKFSFSYYIAGFLILTGVMLGRFVCGFLCPFGWLQELLHKIPTRKFSTERLKALTYVKYAVLAVMVVLLPAIWVNDVGMGDPLFCKYLCPQGVLEGAIPLSIVDMGIRAALGKLFTWKLGILTTVIVLSILLYRPFCKWLCPLGAIYALMNKVSLLGMEVDKTKCVSCGKCAKACKMDVDGRECLVATDGAFEAGRECEIVLRPEAIRIGETGMLPCKVELSCFMGSYQNYHVRVGDTLVKISDNCPINKRVFAVGEDAFISFDQECAHVL